MATFIQGNYLRSIIASTSKNRSKNINTKNETYKVNSKINFISGFCQSLVEKNIFLIFTFHFSNVLETRSSIPFPVLCCFFEKIMYALK